MNKFLYKIKDLEVPSWIKYWFLRKSKINFDLSQILEGTSFDLTDTVNKKLHLINIFGNSVQNGEPTPENPIEIKSAGDNGHIVEKFVNKNLFDRTDKPWYNGTGLQVTSVDKGIYNLNGTRTGNELRFFGAWNSLNPVWVLKPRKLQNIMLDK